MYNKITAAADVGGGHKKDTVVIAQGRGIDPARGPNIMQRKLSICRQAIVDQLPVDQIFAVEHGDTGKELEGRGNEIEVFPYTANARVRMKARQDRVVNFIAAPLQCVCLYY